MSLLAVKWPTDWQYLALTAARGAVSGPLWKPLCSWSTAQSDFRSGVDKLEVVLYLAFETNVINKSSFIFPKNQFYIIRFCFGSSSKFLGPIDFSHFSQKKVLMVNVNFLLITIY